MDSKEYCNLKEKIIELERDWAEAETAIIEKKKLQNDLREKIQTLKNLILNVK